MSGGMRWITTIAIASLFGIAQVGCARGAREPIEDVEFEEPEADVYGDEFEEELEEAEEEAEEEGEEIEQEFEEFEEFEDEFDEDEVERDEPEPWETGPGAPYKAPSEPMED